MVSSASPSKQRNALLPAALATIALVIAPAIIDSEWFTIIRFVVAILALIVAWFAVQARHWWWVPVFLAIAVAWNPVLPIAWSGWWWTLAQPVAALAFLAAGILIATPRADEPAPRGRR